MQALWMELWILWMTWATLAWGKCVNKLQPGYSWIRTYFRTEASAQLTQVHNRISKWEGVSSAGITSRCIHLKSKLLIGSWDLFNLRWLSQFQLVLFRCHLASGEKSNLLSQNNEASPLFVTCQHQDVTIILSPILNLLPGWFFLLQSANWALVRLQHFWHNTVVNF
jgi:hypothetical protein